MHDTTGQDVPAAPHLRYKAASARIGMSESWLRKQVRQGAVPYFKFGKVVAFSPEQVEQIIAAHEHRPTPTPLRTVRAARAGRRRTS